MPKFQNLAHLLFSRKCCSTTQAIPAPGLLATTLRYAYEVRDQGAYFEDIPELKLPAEMIQLASHIIDTKAGHFDPKKFEDHYETALIELLRKKQEGRAIEPVREEGPTPRRVSGAVFTLRRAAGACGRSGTAARCKTSPRCQSSL
jgi:DNA end-binding protein Ku